MQWFKQWTFAPRDFIFSTCTVIMKNIQHNKMKYCSLARFYEGKTDLIHFHSNIFYGFCWVFLPVRQTRSLVVEQCFMTWCWFSLLSLACQTLGLPHSWLSPQWNSTLRSHYSDMVKLGFPSLPSSLHAPAVFSLHSYSSFPHCFCTLLYFVSPSLSSSHTVSLLSDQACWFTGFEIVIWPRHIRALEAFFCFSHCTFFSQGGDASNKGGFLILLAMAGELQTLANCHKDACESSRSDSYEGALLLTC